MATLAEVIARHGPGYLARFGTTMPEWHRRALVRLMACRTYDAGRVYYQCADCGDWQVTAASCGHRACAQCGHHRALAWEARQRERLLPVPYFMVTFTVPSEFRALFKSAQLTCYPLLFSESAGTLQEIALDPRHLGGEIGMTGVLHTWKRDLGYHPHIHYIVPGGAAEPEGWVSPRKAGYLLPSAVLAVRMRNRFRDRLRSEHPELFKRVPLSAWLRPWNVNVQAVGQGDTAFRYLARYVQSTAIRNKRIIACDAETVTYEWVERKSGQTHHEKVTGHEFLRRFLQHALPKGLMRVRHFGFLSAAAKKSFTRVCTWLGGSGLPASEPALSPPAPAAAPNGAPPSSAPVSPPRPGQACCAKCHKMMDFLEHRTARELGHPEGLKPLKRQLLPPAGGPKPHPIGPPPVSRIHSPRGPPATPLIYAQRAPS
jgi:Putative transposase/Transposase zinc-binding domain